MANHDKGKSKRKGSSCALCKPHKQPGVRKRRFVSGSVEPRGIRNSGISATKTWRQEAQAQMQEIEQIGEHAEGWACPCCGGDGASKGCVWCGMPCPDGGHVWDVSDLAGSGMIRCKVCLADGYVEDGSKQVVA